MTTAAQSDHFYHDSDRRLNIARVHDGEGNIYVFNTPPDIEPKAHDILMRGELIATKLKGEGCKRTDSTMDPHFNRYNSVVPFEPLKSGLDTEQLEALLNERRKLAPPPGKETSYPPLTLAARAQAATPAPPEVVMGRSGFRFEKRGDGFYFKGMPIQSRDNGVRFIRNTVPCQKCQGEIVLEATIAFHDGLPWSVGGQKPLERGSAETTSPNARTWRHISCPAPADMAKETEKHPSPHVAGASLESHPASKDGQAQSAAAAPPVREATASAEASTPPAAQAPQAVAAVAPGRLHGLINKMTGMALDKNLSDEAFRGAAYMLFLSMGGGIEND